MSGTTSSAADTLALAHEPGHSPQHHVEDLAHQLVATARVALLGGLRHGFPLCSGDTQSAFSVNVGPQHYTGRGTFLQGANPKQNKNTTQLLM